MIKFLKLTYGKIKIKIKKNLSLNLTKKNQVFPALSSLKKPDINLTNLNYNYRI